MKAKLNDQGLLEGVRYVASPNSDERPAGCAIDLLVIHYISLPPGEFGGADIEAFFTNRLDADAHPFFATIADLRASAHFLIRRDGEVIQFVPCVKRAWHAGESSWKGRSRCNDFSIGIEVEGDGEAPFMPAQYRRLSELTRVLLTRYPITEIVGHSDIAPARKVDPGPRFDWARYRAMIEPPPRAKKGRKKPATRRASSAMRSRAGKSTARTRRRRRA